MAAVTGATDIHTHIVPHSFPAYAGKHANARWPSMAHGLISLLLEGDGDMRVRRQLGLPFATAAMRVFGAGPAGLVHGVEELIVIPFDGSFAAQSPQAFIDHVLVERLCATHVSVGENFRFGHGAAGDTDMLGADPRFETRVVRLVEVDGEIVSSSHIRGLVSAGDVDRATRFLGAPFQMRGEVVTGDRRGRELGFPTANIVPDEELVCPGHGVYAARADGRCAAVSVGVRPTFGTGRAVLVEAYILDFDGDLYGRQLRIDFLARLRGERRFEAVDALVAQMQLDVEQTRRMCG